MKKFFMYAMALSIAMTAIACNRSGSDTAVENIIPASDYELSADKRTLLAWKNQSTTEINMNTHPELKNVTTIHDGVFRAHPALKSIVLPSNLAYIGENAFLNSAITTITLPASLKVLGEDAFAGAKLSSVKIENGIGHIGKGVFRNNKDLTEITLPASITNIGDEAFAGAGLAILTLDSPAPPVLGNAAIPNASIKRILVPAGSEKTYRVANNWIQYSSIIDAKP